jgi:cell division protein FtsW
MHEAKLWGAHAPRVHFSAPRRKAIYEEVRDGEGAVASTRGACAPQNLNMHRKSAYILFLAVLVMLVIGIVMLFSTSAFARSTHNDMYYFIKRQAIWLGIGLVGCMIGALVDYHFWQRTFWIWFTLALIALALCFVPHLGMRINGSRRWVGIGPATFQPSEIAKLAAVIFLAAWFARYEQSSGSLWKGFVLPLCFIGSLLALIVCEVDLGTTALIGATTFAIMFVAGANPALLGLLSLGGIGGIAMLAIRMPERMARLTAFRNLEAYQRTDGLQQMQALIALGSGGVEGLGLGNGRQKMLYLPYAHTDFIFPIIGEELGLRASLFVLFLFVIIIVCGTMIALHAKDRFGLLLATGIVSLIALQAAVNIGVTTSLLPNKGLPLPFISYGGSNLAACLFGIGLLLNIYRQGVLEPSLNQKRVIMQARITPRI